MKNLVILVGLLATLPASGQHKVRNIQQEVYLLKTVLSANHIQPRTIDDAFSEELFDKFVNDVDPDRLFFTQEDITWLGSHRKLLDDEIMGRGKGFFDHFKDRYRRSLIRSQKIVDSILSTSPDFSKKELFDPDDETRASDGQMLLVRHRLWLKYSIAERLTELLERDSVISSDFFETHIMQAVSYVKKRTLRPIAKLLNDPARFNNEVSTAFLQAIANVHDPHSEFFSNHAYDDFIASLSTEDYYFGFSLDEDDKGNVMISGLAPGGPAWKSGDLHVSDVLLGIQMEGEEAVDLSGMNIEDVNEVFGGQDTDEMKMIVRGVDGQEKQINLRRERLAQEENVVQSFILNGEVKTGYIYLPDFYTRWGDDDAGGRSANDVAKEIIRLKKEGIEGLILDLRFNGGGSLYEAAAMAGIFIDEGPLAMVSTRERKAFTIKDMNRGTVYDGPLVVMVNGASASASEVLAGTLQDYNRGVIVGSRTYGKATGQNVFPLQAAGSVGTTKKAASPPGYVKVTTQRLYRVTGKSAQGRGVVPDVALPDIFMTLNLRESSYPFALQPDSIDKNTYFKPFLPFDREGLRQKSRERISQHPDFTALQSVLSLLHEAASRGEAQSLVWEDYSAGAMAFARSQGDVKRIGKSARQVFTVTNSGAKEQRLAVDDYARQVHERWVELLSSDIYLHETYHILRDHIENTKTLK